MKVQYPEIRSFNNMEFRIGILLVTIIQITSAYNHPPPPPIVCTCDHTFAPVCSTNGITYSNKCVHKCVSDYNVKYKLPALGIVCPGPCPAESCICPAVVKPVCGTNGRTYSNECQLGCDNQRLKRLKLSLISVHYHGVCKNPPKCTNITIPVCGSNGRTYRNLCFLQHASELNRAQGQPAIFYKYYGACHFENCKCHLKRDLVCGSNGKTYNNKCAVNCENSRRWALGQAPVKIVGSGTCPVGCKCKKINYPVCASDGKTYRNPCKLNCENVKRKSVGLHPWKQLYTGACIVCNCRNKKYDPYCASDNKTYRNYCLFQCENRKRARRRLHPITTLYRGQCSPCVCNCSNERKEVCASDRKTYLNLCWMECTRDCYKFQGYHGIFFVKDGRC